MGWVTAAMRSETHSSELRFFISISRITQKVPVSLKSLSVTSKDERLTLSLSSGALKLASLDLNFTQ